MCRSKKDADYARQRFTLCAMPKSPVQLPAIRTIDLHQPWIWLQKGWSDMAHTGWLSYAHGFALAIGGMLIMWIAHQKFWLLAGSLSGFMLVAPVLATSLYALSRARERNEETSMAVVLKTWLNWENSHINKWGNDYWCMVQFGGLLALAGTGWVVTSAALITLLAPVPIHAPKDFLEHVVLTPSGHLFELWLALGGMMAAPIFASSVISMPLLLDRRVTLLQAVLTSWKAVLTNPVPMALWAALIMGLSLLGMATFFLGLIPLVPLLGHASWHAYRALVEVEDLPLREVR